MARTVKPAGQNTSAGKPRMHGSPHQRMLMAGKGALIRWSAAHVPVTGNKPGDQQPRRP